ncbi:hypothetical protein [Thiofilum flexile]|uniref:hypothetical protein n=1 Tax=Thiofilum flexile TaxID=125627 RepID=UPI0003728241|nr:hypothetical protein [Thiofilum flexile]
MPTITLIIPQALQTLSVWERDFGFKPHAPSFNSLFNSKRLQTIPVRGVENTVLYLAGVSTQTISLAAWRYAVQFGTLPEKALFCADLVQLESNLKGVRLLPHLPCITAADNEQVSQLLNPFLAQDGLIWLGKDNYGYLLLDSIPNIKTTPLSQVLGEDVFPYLPQGDTNEHLYWHRLLNEIQMLLYAPQLGGSNEPNFNSIWLWGNGTQTASVKTPIQKIIGRGLTMQALAYGLEAEYQDLPKNLSEVDLSVGDTLIVLDELIQPALNEDINQWQSVLSQLEQNWLEPLLKLAQQKKIHLQVSTAEHDCYTVAVKPFWQFWA